LTNRALKRGCSPRGEHRTWSPEDQLSQCEAGNDNEASKKKRKRETLASSKYPDGEKFERESLKRDYEEKLAKAQRHRKKRQVKSIHAKIKNKRQDWNHKASHSLTKRYNTIYFGDADSSKLAQTRMAKGVLDAGWHQIFTFLQYNSLRRGGIVLRVSEKFSTVTCSSCLTRCGPSGLSGLSIREWVCQSCGAVHARDINSATYILRSGRGTMREEAILFFPKGSADYNAISV